MSRRKPVVAPGSAVFMDPGLTLWQRHGRGGAGGSTDLNRVVQRARYQGRRVKPLDGDLRSRTLSILYPAFDTDGAPILDGASSPASEDPADAKKWLSFEFDQMIEEGVSRVLDLGGGDRVLQEYNRDLEVPEFCRDYGIGLTAAFYLGPNMEDFRHVLQGQSTKNAFGPIVGHPDFHAILKDGARAVVMPRLSCLDQLQERGLGIYDAIHSLPDKDGEKASPVLQHMTDKWAKAIELQHSEAGTLEWHP